MSDETDTKLCGNCKRQISANNFMMHEMHCKRHIGLCEHCHEPFRKEELEMHFHESHKKIKCPKCGVEVEIMHLEDHEENDCEKRPLNCVYCELEFPKCDLQAHIDYCGSRTEPCEKCGAYIMLKEQQKHVVEQCGKPKPAARSSKQANAVTTRRDPYDCGSLADALNRGPMSRDPYQPSTSGATGRDIPPPRRPLTEKKPAYKITNVTSDRNNRKKENTNRRPAENELDHLLAMQLASDLDSSRNLEEMVREFEKSTTPVNENTGLVDDYGFNTFSDDVVTIPCEFCGQLFVADELVQHQSGCSLDRISGMLPSTGQNRGQDEPNSYPVLPNNEGAVYREIQSPLVQHPGIIDNLRGFPQDQWENEVFGGIPEPIEHSDDCLLLPCEFCSELFPMDTLVQHQAVCDSNRTTTPRPPSPKAQPRQKTRSTEATRLASEFPNLSSQRRKLPTNLFGNLDNSDDDTRPTGRRDAGSLVHKVQKPKATVMKNGAAHKQTTNTAATSPSQEFRTMRKRYGVETLDRGDYYTRQGSHSHQNSDLSTDSRPQPSARKSSNADRTRSMLDNLLNDTDDTSSHDLLAHIGRENERKAVPKPRQTVSVTKTNTRAQGSVRNMDGVSRTVRSHGISNGTQSQPRNRTSRQGIEVRVRPSEADEISDIVTGNRPAQRPRASHVFNTPVTRKRGGNS